MCEEGKESSVNKVKDCVGTNHLDCIGFDSTSLSSGAWPSLLNKFGYSNTDYLQPDLLAGDGNFAPDDTLWTYTVSRFQVTGGYAYFKAVDATANYITNKRTISFSTTDKIRAKFTVTEAASGARLNFVNQAITDINTAATYTVGDHVVDFTPLAAGTKLGIRGIHTTGAFKIDNISFQVISELGIMCPKMDAAIPTTDTAGRALTFFGQAKYNLIKVDADTVKLPDYVGELFNAANEITVNDWYDSVGVGNSIDLVSIAQLQSYRQYYNNGELILIKQNESISPAEDLLIKRYLKIPTANRVYSLLKSVGATTGTTAQIYSGVQALINSSAFSSELPYTPTTKTYDPTKKYIAVGWADWFTTDRDHTMPLMVKYGVGNTFYRQLKPRTND